MRRTVKELFQFHSGSGALTERAIYEHQPASKEDAVVVYSGATDDQNNLPVCSKQLVRDAAAPLIHGSGILVARKGQAGSMRVINGTFTFNDNAYGMTLKPGATDMVDPLFFVIAYQGTLFDLVTSKDGNGTFAKGVAESLTLWLPDIQMQASIAKAWRKQEGIKELLLAMLKLVQKTLKTSARAEHEKVFLVKELFHVTSGVRITQKEVYENPGQFPIVTAKTENNGVAWYASRGWLEGFKKNGSPVVVDAPCVTWCKNGNAGKLFIRNTPFYPGDDCGVLAAHKPINREWFGFAAQEDIYLGVSSKGGQGKLFEAAMSNITVAVPIDPATGKIDLPKQEAIAAQYHRLQTVESKLLRLIDGCDAAMTRLRQLAIAMTFEPETKQVA